MSRRLSLPLSVVGACLLALAVLFFPQLEAQAQRVRCTVFLTQARIPANLGESGLLAFARRNRVVRAQETTEVDLNSRQWLMNAVFSFSRPPGDLEFHALFYDVHDGARVFIREMSVFVGDRTQRTVLHAMRLPRPMFRPNRRLELVVTLRREEIGRTRFEVSGEEIRHSGQVDFSDEQATARD